MFTVHFSISIFADKPFPYISTLNFIQQRNFRKILILQRWDKVDTGCRQAVKDQRQISGLIGKQTVAGMSFHGRWTAEVAPNRVMDCIHTGITEIPDSFVCNECRLWTIALWIKFMHRWTFGHDIDIQIIIESLVFVQMAESTSGHSCRRSDFQVWEIADNFIYPKFRHCGRHAGYHGTCFE